MLSVEPEASCSSQRTSNLLSFQCCLCELSRLEDNHCHPLTTNAELASRRRSRSARVGPRVGPFAASPWAPSRPSACNVLRTAHSHFKSFVFEKLNAVRRGSARTRPPILLARTPTLVSFSAACALCVKTATANFCQLRIGVALEVCSRGPMDSCDASWF